MNVDPSGHVWYNPTTWDWGTIANVGITVVSGIVAVGKGIKAGIKSYIKTSAVAALITRNPFLGNLLGSIAGFGSFIFTAATTFGTINNAVNAFYYNHVSSGISNLTPSSYNNGYVNRWDRLDYTKSKMKEFSPHYDKSAWMYYSEYSAHIVQIVSKILGFLGT